MAGGGDERGRNQATYDPNAWAAMEAAANDDDYVAPEPPAVMINAAAEPMPAMPAAAAGSKAGAALLPPAGLAAFGRARALSSVKRVTTLPDVVLSAPGHRIEDGTKFPWWFVANATVATTDATSEHLDPILVRPISENPPFDVGWYSRYFYTQGPLGSESSPPPTHTHTLLTRATSRQLPPLPRTHAQSTSSLWANMPTLAKCL